MTGVTDLEHIAISKSKGIKIPWQDWHTSEYGIGYLRDKCPCATAPSGATATRRACTRGSTAPS